MHFLHTAAVLVALATAHSLVAQTLATPSPEVSAAPALAPIAHVEVRGSGPVSLVLIPGLSCDWTVFSSFMERNADAYTMYAVTLPGFGGTPAPPIPDPFQPSRAAWIENAGAAVVQLIEDRKLTKPYVVGHSLGGHVAIRLAIDHGDRFAGAISIDGPPALPLGDPNQRLSPVARAEVIDTTAWPQYAGITDEQWGELIRQMAASGVSDSARGAAIGELMAKTPASTATRYLAEYMAADLTPRLGNLKCPVLMIAAIADQEFSGVPIPALRQFLSETFALSPLSSLVLFESTLHFVTEEAPAELDRAIAAFVAGRPVPGKPPKSPSAPADPNAAGPQLPPGSPS